MGTVRNLQKSSMSLYRYLIFLVALLVAGSSAAQLKGRLIEITGKDTADVPGAMLVWESTTVAATSDASGAFQIPVSPISKRLILKAIGYEEKSISVTDTS